MAISRLRIACVVVTIATSFASCGSDSSPSPAVPSLAGTWVGTETDTVAGVGSLQATVFQNGSTLSGTYALIFPSLPISNNSGTLSGSVSGTNVSMTATPTNPAFCPATDTATVNAAGTQITGTYVAVAGCNLTHQTGSFTVTKQ